MSIPYKSPELCEDGDFTEEERELIGREAVRLRKEFESQRRSVQPEPIAPAEEVKPKSTENEFNGFETLKELDRQMKQSSTQKQLALKELQILENKLRKQKNDLQKTESSLQNSKSKVENEKKQFQFVLNEIDRAKEELKNLESAIINRKNVYENQLKINTSEVMAIIEERNNLRQRLESGDEAMSFIDRLELERELRSTKEENSKMQQLQEKKLDEYKAEIKALHQSLDESHFNQQRLQDKFEFSECDLKEQISKLQKEIQILNTDNHMQKQELENANAVVHQRDLDINSKNNEICDLQAVIVSKERDISAVHDAKSSLKISHAEAIEKIKSDNESLIEALTSKHESRMNRQLEDLNRKREIDLNDIQRKMNIDIERIKHENSINSESLNRDIESLKSKNRQLEEYYKDKIQIINADHELQLKNSISRERNIHDEEMDRALSKLKHELEEKNRVLSEDLTSKIYSEQEKNIELEKRNSSIQLKAEESERLVRKLQSDIDLMKEKDLSKQRLSDQSLKEKDLIIEDRSNEVKGLLAKLEESKKQILLLQCDVDKSAEKMRQMEKSYHHYARTIILELNDAGAKLSGIIGITARNIQFAGGNASKVTTECLAQLQACVSEVAMLWDNQKNLLEQSQRQCDQLRIHHESLQSALKTKLHLEKESELSLLRESLVDQHLDEINSLEERLQDVSIREESLKHDVDFKEKQLNDLQSEVKRLRLEIETMKNEQFQKELMSRFQKPEKDVNVSRPKPESAERQKLIIKLNDQISRLRMEKALGHSSGNEQLLRHLEDRVQFLKQESF